MRKIPFAAPAAINCRIRRVSFWFYSSIFDLRTRSRSTARLLDLS